jgi:Protein of unknown function (DUF3499)
VGAGTIDPMRICARSDCNSPAAAVLTYDRLSQTAYLFAVDGPSARTPGDLCDRHLRRLVLPRSWHLDDRREPEQAAIPTEPIPTERVGAEPEAVRPRPPRAKRLRAVPTAAPATAARAKPKQPVAKAARAPRANAKRKWAEVVEPSLFDASNPAAAAAPDAAADEVAETEPWMPRFEPDELGGVLDAKTPLLRRAFGGN